MSDISIPEYIIKNLKEYKNAAIGKCTFPSFEKNKNNILLKLKDMGFNCKFKMFINEETDFNKTRSRTKIINTYIIFIDNEE